MDARCLSNMLIATIFLAGCDDVGSDNRPNLPSCLPEVVYDIGKAKQAIEGLGHIAKTQIRRNNDGQQVYIESIARHNGCIEFIKTGLDVGMDEGCLRGHLHEADVARTELMEWCKNHGPRKKPIEARRAEATAPENGAVGDLPADLLVGLVRVVVDYDVELRKLDQKARTERIDRISKTLDACKCRQWSDLM